MKSEIRSIRVVHKDGAYGSPSSSGKWIYGRRPDGRTVACRKEMLPSSGIRIWSYWQAPGCAKDEFDVCATEFSAEEWSRIEQAPSGLQPRVSNEILNRRSGRKR